MGSHPAIGLLGDVMLGRGVAQELSAGDPAAAWGRRLRSLLAGLDLVVCNLECCLSAGGRPTRRIPGKPFFFRGPPALASALDAIGVDAAGLANNHALDYETEALADTLTTLVEHDIAAAGAGPDESHARRGVVLTAGGHSIGLLAVTDHPDSYAAGPDVPGVAYAPLRHGVPDWLGEELEALRARCDLVVAFPHWGPNMTARPAPWQRSAARALQAAGADLVAGHSSHVFHGADWSEAGPVLSDLGGALDDYAVDAALRNDLGLLAVWRPGSAVAIELVGLRLSYAHTDLADGPDADWIATRLRRACGELGTRVERMGEQRFRIDAA